MDKQQLREKLGEIILGWTDNTESIDELLEKDIDQILDLFNEEEIKEHKLDSPEPLLVKLDKGEDPSLYSFSEGAQAQRKVDIKYYTEHKLDSPDRETIACLVCGRRTRAGCMLVFKNLSSHWCEEALELANQIIALFNEEEIRKQERERIFKELLKHQTPTIKDLGLIEITMCVEDFKALKEGQGEG